jgi:hypothetical protein
LIDLRRLPEQIVRLSAADRLFSGSAEQTEILALETPG